LRRRHDRHHGGTQPSLEDIVRGIIPGIPKVRFHNPVLAYENGEDSCNSSRCRRRARWDPFILVIEGSIPEREEQGGRLLGRLWNGRGDRPADPTCEWIDRLAPKAWAVVTAGTCAAYGGIHAMEGNPTGAMGLADYLGWQWKSKRGIPIVNVPGCPVQPDNFMETLLYLLRQAAGGAPMIPLDEPCGRRGFSARRSTRAAIAAATTSRRFHRGTTARSSAS
jgi:hydrogenase small subunit